MTRRQTRRASRHRRRGSAAGFLYVLSFAEAVRRRRRPPGETRPHAPAPTPPRPRPLAEQRPLTLKTVATLALGPARTREMEDA